MISEDEARAISQAYLEQRPAGYTFRFFMTPQKRSDDWTMAFEAISASGSVLDGPIIVVVDKRNGRARSLTDDVKERFRRD
jgi:hypothetical protein